MSEDKDDKAGSLLRFETEELFGLMGEIGPGAEGEAVWVQVHDFLLEQWLRMYEEQRQQYGIKPGKQAIMPVQITARNLICMHDCPCMKDAELMFGIFGRSTPGSRYTDWGLVVTCEQCLRDTGYLPAEEDTNDGKYDA